MNEIKHIHLGRQAFTIALDAHTDLRKYIDAIKKRADAEVVAEIELRMAELLLERGITDKKVVLPSDVDFLKENLGQPSDFSDDEDGEQSAESTDASKRLFRDADDVWLGGVASGIAAYIDMPAWTIRLAFALLTPFWGGGIAVYILLWILLPEAKTPSDRLRMRGKPVTLETIKELVQDETVHKNAKEIGDRAARVAAHASVRAVGVGSKIVARVFKVVATLVGIGLTVAGLAGALYIIGMGSYAFISPENLFGVGQLFPIGKHEYFLLGLVMVIGVVAGALLASAGVGLVKRRWPVAAWLTAGMAAIVLAGTAIAVPLGITTGQNVADRYEASKKTETYKLEPFSNLAVYGEDTEVTYEYSDSYSMEVTAFGKLNQSRLAHNEAGTLAVDAGAASKNSDCNFLCINRYDRAKVIVRAPKLDKVNASAGGTFVSKKPLHQKDFLLDIGRDGYYSMQYVYPERIEVTELPYGMRTVQLTNLLPANPDDTLDRINSQDTIITRANAAIYKGLEPCIGFSPRLYIQKMPPVLNVNSKSYATKEALVAEQDLALPRDANCVTIF